jgi:hypothetical protein
MGTIEHQGKAPSTEGTDERPNTTPKPGKSLRPEEIQDDAAALAPLAAGAIRLMNASLTGGWRSTIMAALPQDLEDQRKPPSYLRQAAHFVPGTSAKAGSIQGL